MEKSIVRIAKLEQEIKSIRRRIKTKDFTSEELVVLKEKLNVLNQEYESAKVDFEKQYKGLCLQDLEFEDLFKLLQQRVDHLYYVNSYKSFQLVNRVKYNDSFLYAVNLFAYSPSQLSTVMGIFDKNNKQTPLGMPGFKVFLTSIINGVNNFSPDNYTYSEIASLSKSIKSLTDKGFTLIRRVIVNGKLRDSEYTLESMNRLLSQKLIKNDYKAYTPYIPLKDIKNEFWSSDKRFNTSACIATIANLRLAMSSKVISMNFWKKDTTIANEFYTGEENVEVKYLQYVPNISLLVSDEEKSNPYNEYLLGQLENISGLAINWKVMKSKPYSPKPKRTMLHTDNRKVIAICKLFDIDSRTFPSKKARAKYLRYAYNNPLMFLPETYHDDVNYYIELAQELYLYLMPNHDLYDEVIEYLLDRFETGSLHAFDTAISYKDEIISKAYYYSDKGVKLFDKKYLSDDSGTYDE